MISCDKRGGFQEELRGLFTKTRFVPDVSSSYLLGVAVTFSMEGRYCPTWCGTRSVVDGLAFQCRNRGGKVTTIQFHYNHVPIVETRF